MILGDDIPGAISAGWLAIRDEALSNGVTEDQFRAFIAQGWTVQSFDHAGKTVGIWATRGPRCHAAILPEARGHWSRRLLRELISPLMARFGRLESRATTATGRDFLRRIGFVQEGQDYVLRGMQ